MKKAESASKQHFRVNENLFLVHEDDRRVTSHNGEEELVQVVKEGALDVELNTWAPQIPYAVNVTRRYYAPLLVLAIKSELLRLSAALIEQGADVELAAVPGCPKVFKPAEYPTPIKYAISMLSAELTTSFHREPALESSLKMTHLLIGCGVDVNRLSGGRPPLLYAVGRPRVIEALLDAGADPFQVSEDGFTALDEAAGRADPESYEILRRAMGHHDGLG